MTPLILNLDTLPTASARYWKAKAEKLAGKCDVIDPARRHLSTLRSMFPKGYRVHRASTGGKWGKSAVTVTL